MACGLEETTEVLAERLLAVCRKQGFHLAVAESCTGGLIGAELTAVAGASDVFNGGVMAYQNAIKHAVLAVPETVLRRPGAVSEPCAEAMALGVARLMQAEVALSATGIAGPGGGSSEKPVGTVCIGCTVCGEAHVRTFRFRGSRCAVRAQTVREALILALTCLQKERNENGRD